MITLAPVAGTSAWNTAVLFGLAEMASRDILADLAGVDIDAEHEGRRRSRHSADLVVDQALRGIVLAIVLTP